MIEGVNINIIRKDVKSLSMRTTKEGGVNVSAPLSATQKEIDDFISKHESWIEKNVPKTLQRVEAKNNFYSQLPLLTHRQQNDARRKLSAIILPLIEKYSKMMNVTPGSIVYSATKSQWGRCTDKTHNLQFSYYLLLLPEWCIEHVVVHELAHIIEPNHSPAFYAVVDKYYSRRKEAMAETSRLSGNTDEEEM